MKKVVLWVGATAALLISLAAFLYILSGNHMDTYQMHGDSMEPTISEGQELRGKPVTGDELNRGDIVVISNPENTDTRLVKRVVGLPGDKVVIKDGVLSVTTPSGGEYIPYDNFTYGDDETVVPQNTVYVVGDNRAEGKSVDSRNMLGSVPFENVIAIVVEY